MTYYSVREVLRDSLEAGKRRRKGRNGRILMPVKKYRVDLTVGRVPPACG
jgi:hypothetical protein